MSPTLLLNSLAVGLGTTVLALGAGLLLALAVAAASRGRGIILGSAAACLALPSFLTTSAWLDVTAKSRGLMPPEVVERGSLFLTVVTLASLLWPLTTFLVLGAWTKLQPELLEADPQLRGTRLLRGLLLPAARAELTVAAAVTVAMALANFTVPVLFQVRVFTEEFWIRFNTQFDMAGAVRASWPLLLVPLVPWFVIRSRTVSWPRLHRPDLPARLGCSLGRWEPVGFAFSAGWLALSLAFPLVRLGMTGRTWWELPGAVGAGQAALMNTMLTAAGTAVAVTGGGLLLATSGHSRIAGWLARLTWLPFLLPGVFLGVALITVFNRPPFLPLYQGLGILLTALLIRHFAPGFALVTGSIGSADSLQADAARSLGASRWRVFRDVLWPQIAPGAAAAWYATYLLCLWDVETVVLIQPPAGETLALRVFNLLHYGHAAQVNALCIVMLGLAIAPLMLWEAWRWVGTRLRFFGRTEDFIGRAPR